MPFFLALPRTLRPCGTAVTLSTNRGISQMPLQLFSPGPTPCVWHCHKLSVNVSLAFRNWKKTSCSNHLPVVHFSRDHFLTIRLSHALFLVHRNCQVLPHSDGSCYLLVPSCAALRTLLSREVSHDHRMKTSDACGIYRVGHTAAPPQRECTCFVVGRSAHFHLYKLSDTSMARGLAHWRVKIYHLRRTILCARPRASNRGSCGNNYTFIYYPME